MKTKITISKENDYSLQNIENYYNNLNEKNNEISITYCRLMIDFLILICDKLSLKNKDSNKFIIMRGINTLTNIFNSLLFYTKNLNLTSFHVEKSYYYYTEFVEQISEDQHAFLQLTSRDASMYVYKKTILDINAEIKKNIDLSLANSKNRIFKHLLEFSKIIRIIIEKTITNDLKFFKNNTEIILLLNKLGKIDINEEILDEINKVLNILNANINDNTIYIVKLNEFVNIASNSNKLKKYCESLSNDLNIN